jgi:glycerate dehydrogenase
MKIVVLDGYTLNPGDLDWAPLAAHGELEIHPRSAPGEVLERAAGAEVLLTNKVVLDADRLAQLPDLQYIGVTATGTNVVDLAAAKAKGIVVTNVPAYSTPSVAEHVFALLLALARRVEGHSTLVRDGRWSEALDFSFWEGELVELSGRRLGLVGFGAIAQAVARIALAFGMRVMVTTAHPERHRGELPGVTFHSLEELLAGSDVVSLHCPLTPETEHLLDARRLALMRPGAFLLNTGRGPLIDEAALAAALNAGHLAGAGLDVLSSEPPPLSNPLLQARNCLITPHIAWATRASRSRLLEVVAANVGAFLAGKLRNVVN